MSATLTSVSVPPGEVYVAETSNCNVVSEGGSHTFVLTGSGNTVTAAVGTQMAIAVGGSNTLNFAGTTGDTIYIDGGNNVVTAGSGTNQIFASVGSGNVIVMGAGLDEITLIGGADTKLDFTTALAATDWNGEVSGLANYIHMTSGPAGISIGLSATSGGSPMPIATVSVVAGTQWTEDVLFAHVIS